MLGLVHGNWEVDVYRGVIAEPLTPDDSGNDVATVTEGSSAVEDGVTVYVGNLARWESEMEMPFDTSSLVACPNTEDRYREWVKRNPHGFVINAFKEPEGKRNNAMMWHQADCDHIDPKFASLNPRFLYVTSDRLKACSTNPAALAIWAKDRVESLTYCAGCYHRWLADLTSNNHP